MSANPKERAKKKENDEKNPNEISFSQIDQNVLSELPDDIKVSVWPDFSQFYRQFLYKIS